MKNELNTLLQKEMDRKDFLKHVGIGFAVITGAATLVKTLNNFGRSTEAGSDATSGASSYGYGASAYGGGSGLTRSAAEQRAAIGTYS